MDGVLVIDKPSGPTSHDVCQIIKKITGADKVGHLGTLDPEATGVLPIVLNGATKLASKLAGEDKEYVFTLHLGIETDTDDNTGKVLSVCPVGEYVAEKLEQLVPTFVGTVMQRPPQYSAIKKSGKRAYEIARSGESVVLEPRKIKIESLCITRVYLPFVDLVLKCNTGTYVRSLCRDIGKSVGVGGHAEVIRRTRSGNYSIDMATGLPELIIRSGLWKDKLIAVSK